MILLLTASSRAQACVTALQEVTGREAESVNSVRAAMSRLRRREYSALVVDDNLMEPDPLAQETLIQHLGTGVPIYVNFAVHSVERIVREVQMALRRYEAERQIAVRAAAQTLRNELKDAVTGILLSSELALSVPALPGEVEVKIRFVHELAQNMRRQLETAG